MLLRRTENTENVHISGELSAGRNEQVREATRPYEGFFSYAPGRTDLAECDLRLTHFHPIQVRRYPLLSQFGELLETICWKRAS